MNKTVKIENVLNSNLNIHKIDYTTLLSRLRINDYDILSLYLNDIYNVNYFI